MRLSVRHTVRTSRLCVFLCFLPVLSCRSSPPLPGAKLRPALKPTPGFQSLCSWASYGINPLLVLIDVRVTSSPQDCSGSNVWATSWSLLKHERDDSYCNWVTNVPTTIFMATVVVKHKYCLLRQWITSEANTLSFTPWTDSLII